MGSVLVTGIITAHRSRWFRGPYALVFADPRPAPFLSARGQVGLFMLLIKIEISVEAIAKTLPVGSVGYEAEANERGERLIVMVRVGLGYIVTDAI